MGKHELPETTGAAGTVAVTTVRGPEKDPLAVPGPSAEVEAQRRKALRRHKAFALGLLIFAAVVYLICRYIETRPGDTAAWVGFVRAASEAGMIGGLADWFAVTALFRHPMGLPIPHTALIRKKKDELGVALSSFVGENFLNAQLITEKVRQAKIPERAGQWLAQPENSEVVSREVGKLTANVVKAIDPEDAEAVINSALIDKLAEPAWGPPLGRLLDQLIAEGKAEPVVQQLTEWVHKKALGSEDLIDRLLNERRPIWAPKFVNELVGDRVYRELIQFTEAVSTDPNHEARQSIRRFLTKLATDLQYDAGMITKVEEIKHDVMGSAAVTQAAPTIWASASASLIDAASDPDSMLRRKIAELSVRWGERVLNDETLRTDLDRRLMGAATFLADNYAPEVTGIISETIERWDADEASDKIELMVGKDLQWIRVNGTVVGALAGLAIYTVSHLMFGA
ncbi:hypothetical protein HMPREF0290_2985 [Corynebacterium efficiens YS-314]|nr:DUF445 domain-containing protein [Corynebacterium efficiens]EEW48419.1 hypothetical protein HMPREF0290_2985 [Corynebacterium efficiens YS-314]